jgi:hypothetical protein
VAILVRVPGDPTSLTLVDAPADGPGAQGLLVKSLAARMSSNDEEKRNRLEKEY